MLYFSFDCATNLPKIDKTDFSLSNIKCSKQKIKELEFSKLRLSGRLNEIIRRIKRYKKLLIKLKMNLLEKNIKIIEIRDDKYEKF